MPAGELLAARVLQVLSVFDGKTTNEIGAALTPPVTGRAVRYAILLLIASGKAKRIGKRGQHFKVLAVAEGQDAVLRP
jgi:hypothetical protein